MNLEVHVYHHFDSGEKVILAAINHLKDTLMETQEQLATDLQALSQQADKAKAEIVQKLADLEAAIATAGSTTPAVDAALAALKASVQGVDDIVADQTA